MKMRKVLSALLVAACTLSLAACGSSSSKSETTGASGETAGSSANTAKVIDVDLTSEEYAFGVDKTQPELLNRQTHLSRRSKMTVHWMPSVQNISVMMNLKLLNQQSLTVPKTSWL